MSEPKYPEPQIAEEAIYELCSSISSLNMYPEPIYADTKYAYLSDSDTNVRHAIKHLECVMKYLCNLRDMTQQIIKESEEND